MRTRSSARRILSPIEDPERLLSRKSRSEPSLHFNLEEDDIAGQAPPQGPIPDLRSMEELLQAPTDGVGDAIVIDTFYNSLSQSDQDSLNSAANGNFLTKNTQEALTIIENKSKVQTSRNKTQVPSASGSSNQDAHITSLTKQVEALLSLHRPVNSVQNSCETCGGPHAYYECQAAGGYTQEDVYSTTAKALHERPQGALPSNTEPNPREQVNSIMTRCGLTTAEPSIPPPVPPTPRVEVEKEPETLMDEVHITSPKSTAHVPPPGVQPVSPPKPKEDPKPNPHQPKILHGKVLGTCMYCVWHTRLCVVLACTVFGMQGLVIPYPSRLNKTKLLDKNDVQISKFLKILKQLHFDISLMDALTQIPKFTKVLKDFLKDKEKLEELANTPINAECSAILLNKVPEKLEDPGKETLVSVRNVQDQLSGDCSVSRNRIVVKLVIYTILLASIDFSRDRPISASTTFPSDSSPSSALVETISSPITDIDIIDPILERFTDEPALIYSSLLGDDDDDLFDLKSDNDEWKKLLYGDSYNDTHSKNDKTKDSKTKSLIDEANIVELNILPPQLLTSDSTLPGESFEIATMLSSPFENEDKVFNPGILILGGT
ncbi:hypothetical protein Tco_0923835 [Tanacetum coccineum]|uniref:Reverse transcriptase domain-containing protein n=1 Tax=Tanacetum coccineum TaxID=301880 RepID=A0ABQ5D281_9ASTR